MARDLYKAYVENGVVGSDPLQLVIAMYETAIQRTREAKAYLEQGDIWGRTRAISKVSNILTELIVSLNPNVAPEMGRNLDRLYHRMQIQLQEAHIKRTVEPLVEVEKILKDLLEAWYKVAENSRAETSQSSVSKVTAQSTPGDSLSSYDPYLRDGDEPDRFAMVG